MGRWLLKWSEWEPWLTVEDWVDGQGISLKERPVASVSIPDILLANCPTCIIFHSNHQWFKMGGCKYPDKGPHSETLLCLPETNVTKQIPKMMIHSMRWPPLVRVQFRHKCRKWLTAWNGLYGSGKTPRLKYVFTTQVLKALEFHHENLVPLHYYCHGGMEHRE